MLKLLKRAGIPLYLALAITLLILVPATVSQHQNLVAAQIKPVLIGFLFMWGLFAFFGFAITVSKKNPKKQMMECFKKLSDFEATDQFISDDKKTAIAIDEKRKKICLLHIHGFLELGTPRLISYKDILSVELYEDGDTVTKTNRGSQLGGVLLGGLVLGGVGAIIGGLSGQQTSKSKVSRIDLRLIVNDTQAPIHDICFLNLAVKKGGMIYNNTNTLARRWHGLITVLIKQADSEDSLTSSTSTSTSSTADELKKIADLKAAGILTQEEFDIQKSKILDN